jgi:hypothetical protein
MVVVVVVLAVLEEISLHQMAATVALALPQTTQAQIFLTLAVAVVVFLLVKPQVRLALEAVAQVVLELRLAVLVAQILAVVQAVVVLRVAQT